MSIIDWNSIPDLDIKHYNRDYIDYIKEEQMTTNVMKGKDNYGRCFVVAKFDIEGKKLFQTFFQRYENIPGLIWESNRELFNNSIRSEEWKFVEKIIIGNDVICPKDSFINEEYAGKKIKIYGT